MTVNDLFLLMIVQSAALIAAHMARDLQRRPREAIEETHQTC